VSLRNSRRDVSCLVLSLIVGFLLMMIELHHTLVCAFATSL
jgi:hypothetical protein